MQKYNSECCFLGLACRNINNKSAQNVQVQDTVFISMIMQPKIADERAIDAQLAVVNKAFEVI